LGSAIYITAFRTFELDLNLELAQISGLLFLDQAQYYSTGAFRALDYAVAHPYLYGMHYGALTFGAFDEILGYAVISMGFHYNLLNEAIGGILDNNIWIGTNNFNALYTCVFRYYFDFGIAGVALFSLGLGAFFRRSVILFNEFPCVSTLSICLFLFGACFLSSQNWHLAGASALLFLINAFLFYRLERKHLQKARGIPEASRRS